jgi:hypothetical protein
MSEVLVQNCRCCVPGDGWIAFMRAVFQTSPPHGEIGAGAGRRTMQPPQTFCKTATALRTACTGGYTVVLEKTARLLTNQILKKWCDPSVLAFWIYCFRKEDGPNLSCRTCSTPYANVTVTQRSGVRLCDYFRTACHFENMTCLWDK